MIIAPRRLRLGEPLLYISIDELACDAQIAQGNVAWGRCGGSGVARSTVRCTFYPSMLVLPTLCD